MFAPFLGLYFGWFIILFWRGLGFDGLQIVNQIFGLNGVLEWFFQRRLSELKIFSGMHWLVFFMAGFLISCRGSKENKQALLNIFLLSGALGGLSLIFEKLELWPSILPKIELHWTITERASGFFTDPNSAGLFLGLMLPFLFKGTKNRSLWCLLGLLIFVVAGFVSGSRTFLLALAFSLLLSFRSTKIKILLSASALFVIASLFIVAKVAPDSYKSIAGSFPRSIERAALTLASSEGNDSVESRLLFFNLAKWIWQDHKISGIGPGQFPNVIDRYEHRLSVKLYGWRDNANNFYMGILAELGLMGGIALVIFGIFLYRGIDLGISAYSKEAVQSLLILLILLFLGPHLDFAEVGLLVGFLVGSISCSTRAVPKYFSRGSFALFLTLTLIFGGFHHSGLFQGNYHHPEVKWTSVSATLKMPCVNNLVHLKISGRPIESEPLQYQISTEEESIKGSISFKEVQNKELRCSGQSAKVRVLTLNPFKFFPPGSSVKKYSLRGIKILNYSVN
jgi:O-antigen ligase